MGLSRYKAYLLLETYLLWENINLLLINLLLIYYFMSIVYFFISLIDSHFFREPQELIEMNSSSNSLLDFLERTFSCISSNFRILSWYLSLCPSSLLAFPFLSNRTSDPNFSSEINKPFPWYKPYRFLPDSTRSGS